MKVFLTAHLEDKEDMEISKILLNQYEDGTIGFAIHLLDNHWAHIHFQENLYEFFKKKFITIAEYEKEAVVIDADWAVSILDRLEAQEEFDQNHKQIGTKSYIHKVWI